MDQASRIFAIIIGLLMVYVTCHFSEVASTLSEQGIEMSEAQRKFSIRPRLEVLSGMNYTSDYGEIVVPVRNYGSGSALGLRALVAYDGKIREADHQFVSLSGSPTTSGKVLQNEPGTQQEMFTLGETKGKDWVAPDETVRFLFNPWLNVERPEGAPQPNREFTIFLSFFDVDHNEFLTILKYPIGGPSALIILPWGSDPLMDSLFTVAQAVRLFQSKTFDNLRFRAESGAFIKLDTNSTN